MKYLGIDIGGTAVKYGIVDEMGIILMCAEFSVAFDCYKTPIGKTVLNTSKKFLEDNCIMPIELKGIGVSATGQIDTIQGCVAGAGGNIDNWIGTKLKEDLEKQFQLPVTVLNDANCVAIGEQWVGAAKNYENTIVITVGTGIGGGIIEDGNVLLGHHGFAGELGHFSIERNGKKCTCGNRGCYEQYASMTALIQTVRETNLFTDQGTIPKEINGKIIFDMVKDGNELVAKIVDQWIDDIAFGLVSLTHIFNPELILIGGAVSSQEELFIAKVRKLVQENAMENFGKDLEVKAAMLGNAAGLVGAVKYFLESQL